MSLGKGSCDFNGMDVIETWRFLVAAGSRRAAQNLDAVVSSVEETLLILASPGADY